ncbi:MAG: transposase [Bacteroidetes bacterium]|nr:transposase [Bacteroidota bacterium]
MSNSRTFIWIHAVWSTRNLSQLIHPKLERRLFRFIHEHLQSLGCKVLIVNGASDHVHCLFRQNHKMALSDIIGPTKGLSSHYVNYHNLTSGKFAWQEGFEAVSVSHEELRNIFESIAAHPGIHETASFEDELNKLLEAVNPIHF